MDYHFDKTTNQIMYAGWDLVNYYSGFIVPEIQHFIPILNSMTHDTPKVAITKFYDYYNSLTRDRNVRDKFRETLFYLLDVEPPTTKGCCLFTRIDKASLERGLKELDQKIADIRDADLRVDIGLKAS